jgi:type II secretory pathway pseudopilin PulG
MTPGHPLCSESTVPLVAVSTLPPSGPSLPRPRRAQAGFTLIEALVATALLGFSLIVMFGFHNQAVRSNMHARKMTDCTYLAQAQMEKLMALPWDVSTGTPSDLSDGMTDAAGEWDYLEHPNAGGVPNQINAAMEYTDTLGQKPDYYISWDVEDMDSSPTWVRLRVRCQYRDDAFNRWHGTTVSSYRFRDT